MNGCASSLLASGRYRRAALAAEPANARVFEAALLDGELVEVEVGPVAQHRVQDPAQAVRHRDHRHLVATACAQTREVRMEGMVRVPRMMGSFAQHGAQLARAA